MRTQEHKMHLVVAFVVDAAEEAQNERQQVRKLPPSASHATGTRLMRATAKKIVLMHSSGGSWEDEMAEGSSTAAPMLVEQAVDHKIALIAWKNGAVSEPRIMVVWPGAETLGIRWQNSISI